MRRMTAVRRPGIDFWRGFALLTIFVNHIPGHVLYAFTHRNFGVSDAAELFVLLAGVSAAFAYLRDSGAGLGSRRIVDVLMRAFQLYVAHLALVLVAVAVIGAFVVRTGDMRVLQWFHLDVLVAQPVEALVGVALLTFQPAYLNILPLYVSILLLLPVLLLLFARSTMLGLAVSLALYVAAQLFGWAPPVWPNDGGWSFNPLAWQFLFACGLALGQGIESGVRVSNRVLDVVAPAYLAAAAAWALLDYPVTPDFSPLPAFLWDFDKVNLTLPRLLHVLALAYCVSRLPLGRLYAHLMAQPLVVMGRHPLPVFCLGTVLSLAAQVMRPEFAGALSFDLLILAAGVLGQGALAFALDWHRHGVRRADRTAATR